MGIIAAMEELPVDIAEARWYEDEPTYQVVFWQKLNDPDPPLRPMWWSHSTRLAGVKDIYEVLEWAEAHADGRDIAIYVELDRGKENGNIRLLGVDPTWGD
jgi:hypothetical protein